MKKNIAVISFFIISGFFNFLIAQSERNGELYTNGATKFANGDYTSAIKDLGKFINLNAQNKGISVSIHVDDSYWKIGLSYFRLRNFTLADEMFNKLIPRMSYQKEFVYHSYVYKGLMKYFDKKFTEAISDFSLATESYKKNTNAYLMRGICYHNKYSTSKSSADSIQFTNDFNIVLKDKKAKKEKAFALYYLGQKEEAYAQMKELTSKKPSVAPYYEMACLCALNKNNIEAISNIELALKNEFKDTTFLFNEPRLADVRKSNEFNDLLTKLGFKKPDYIIKEETRIKNEEIKRLKQIEIKRIDSLKQIETRRIDSLKQIEIRKIDSLKQIEIIRIDSLKQVEMKRIDSINMINSYIYHNDFNQFIFQKGVKYKYIDKSPETTLLFALLLNETYFSTFELPKGKIFSYSWTNEGGQMPTVEFDLSKIPGLETYSNDVAKLDQFAFKEKENELRTRFVTSWKLLNEELKSKYNLKDSILTFRSKIPDGHYNRSFEYCIFNKENYSIDNNTIITTLLDYGWLHTTEECSEFPYFPNTDQKNGRIAIPISFQDAKNLIQGDEQVYFEKLFTVKMSDYIDFYLFINSQYAKFTNRFDLLSVKYNFYKESQWNTSINGFLGKPVFEYKYFFPVKKELCFSYSDSKNPGNTETIYITIQESTVSGTRHGEVNIKGDRWGYEGSFSGTINNNMISVTEKTIVEGDEQINNLKFILVNDNMLKYGGKIYKVCKK